MRRTIAFLLAVCCCAGLIWGCAEVLMAQSDDLRYTLTTHQGDSSVLDGRKITAAIQCGDHLRWDAEFAFGEEDWFDTRFLFSQEELREDRIVEYANFQVYSVSGFGASSDRELPIRNTGFGDMIRTVAVVTPNGEEREMHLRLADYVNYHALNYDLSYHTEEFICSEYVDAMNFYVSLWDTEALGMEQWLDQYASGSYKGFCELFRFPVGEDEIVSVSVSKDRQGGIVDINYNVISGRDAGFVTAVCEGGVYCVPVFREGLDSAKGIPGEYAQGMGIYFIPWRLMEGDRNGAVEAFPDTWQAENIYPLPDTTVTFGLEMTPDGSGAWLLTQEEGWYVLSLLDLEEGRVEKRIVLMELPDAGVSQYPTWYHFDGLIAVEAGGRLALVDDRKEAELVFVTELGEAKQCFWNFDEETGDIWYEDGLLILADTDEYTNAVMEILACDAGGVRFWGACRCGIYDCVQPGYYEYWIRPAQTPVSVE